MSFCSVAWSQEVTLMIVVLLVMTVILEEVIDV
jgi:hypothetical protein